MSHRRDDESRVAIVGMACLFPDAPDLDAFWQNLCTGHDSTRDVPPERWDPEVFFDAASSAPDRFYTRRGAFLDGLTGFDPSRYGIMPRAAQGAEPDQLLMLDVCARALEHAGLAALGTGRTFARDRTGVVLGRGNYIGAGMTRLEQHVRTAEQLVLSLRGLLPELDAATLQRIKAEFRARLGAYGPDTAIGLVPNLTASRVANRLDLGGGAWTVDAACASSLVALDQACRDVRTGRLDVALAGGVHLSHDVAFWSVFCQLGALSRSGVIRPFDRRADGILIGEGLGVVVLKRLADALKDDDHIWAVIRGTGTSSDGRDASLMSPRVEGQLRALERAWQDAGLDPQATDAVGLVEAHGTGTPAGDAAELETLARFFGTPSGGAPAAIGSVKSNIGHAMPAAGAAGLLKATLALAHGEIPPTLHCDEPRPELLRTRFQAATTLTPWGDRPARATVNAFGFGGINAHVVLERYAESRQSGPLVRAAPALPKVARFAADSATALAARLASGDEGGEGPFRAAVVEPTPDRLAKAQALARAGATHHSRDGLHVVSAPTLGPAGGRIAFLCPGIEAEFAPEVADIAHWLGRPVPACLRPRDLEEHGVGVVGLGRLLGAALARLGISPHAIAGHSIGEWTGLILSGWLDEADADAFVGTLTPGTLEVPGVAFAALGAGLPAALEALSGLPNITVSHDNCPHQVVLCGATESIALALERLRGHGIIGQTLPFRSGFHSVLFEPYVAPHAAAFAGLTLRTGPRTPLWSATTAAPYPADPDGVRELSVRHLTAPVRFRALIDALWSDGCRAFVQLGQGSLPAFVRDTLTGRPALALSLVDARRPGLQQVAHVAAALWSEGADVQWQEPSRPRGTPLMLSLGVPLVPATTPLQLAPRPDALPATPVGDALRAVLGAARDASAEVVAALGTMAPVQPTTRQEVRELSVETLPELRDHSFFRQPEGWPHLADRYPVVPMTASLELVRSAAVALFPGQVAIAVENVRASRWIAVAPAVRVTITAKRIGPDRVQVTLDGADRYLEAQVQVAPTFPASPSPTLALTDPTPPPLDATALYADHWMFHGPAYQGVTALEADSPTGIAGTLRAGRALGALLDNAGQLFGLWIMLRTETDRLAMPVKIDRLAWFGHEPTPGETFTCTVRPGPIGRREVRADLQLTDATGRVRVAITGWEDWRFETDARLWPVMREPERHVYAEPMAGGWVRLLGAQRSAASRDYLARRFLNADERALYDTLGDARKPLWLLGRIAAKDAVRTRAFASETTIFPSEVTVLPDASGRPVVHGRFAGTHVSLAHKDGVGAVAIASAGPCGIDVERVEPRSDRFVALACTEPERALIAAQPSGERDLWVTRLWCAKEAVAKARGTGLEFQPKGIEVTRLDADGSAAWVGETEVRFAFAAPDVVVAVVRGDERLSLPAPR